MVTLRLMTSLCIVTLVISAAAKDRKSGINMDNPAVSLREKALGDRLAKYDAIIDEFTSVVSKSILTNLNDAFAQALVHVDGQTKIDVIIDDLTRIVQRNQQKSPFTRQTCEDRVAILRRLVQQSADNSTTTTTTTTTTETILDVISRVFAENSDKSTTSADNSTTTTTTTTQPPPTTTTTTTTTQPQPPPTTTTSPSFFGSLSVCYNETSLAKLTINIGRGYSVNDFCSRNCKTSYGDDWRGLWMTSNEMSACTDQLRECPCGSKLCVCHTIGATCVPARCDTTTTTTTTQLPPPTTTSPSLFGSIYDCFNEREAAQLTIDYNYFRYPMDDACSKKCLRMYGDDWTGLMMTSKEMSACTDQLKECPCGSVLCVCHTIGATCVRARCDASKKR